MSSTVQQPSHSLTTTQQFQNLSTTNSTANIPTPDTTITVNHPHIPSQLAPHSTLRTLTGTQVGDMNETDQSNEQARVLTPPTTTQPPKKGRAKNAPRHTPAMDASKFESECLRKQINIAHAKIQELETELDKVKNTNFILGERIKTFEATNTKEVYERYFPRNPNTTNSTASNNQDIPTHHYHNPQHPHCCYPSPPCRASYCQPSGHDTRISEVVRELSSKVTRLGSNVVDMKSDILDCIISTLTKHSKDDPIYKGNSQVPEALSDAPQPEHSLFNVSDTSNMSEANSIDDNVHDLSPHKSLNCLVTTTQLQQLGHIQQCSRL